MHKAWIVMTATLVVLVVALIVWLGQGLGGDSDSQTDAGAGGTGAQIDRPLRIGIIPERDIFEQRRRYRALAEYVGDRLDREVQLVTCNSYLAVLRDFEQGAVDAAFLGSMVSVLAMDRHGAEVIVKPEFPGGISTYTGILFTVASSPVNSLDDLKGRSIAMVKSTTAGDLFPVSTMIVQGLLTDEETAPRIIWVGTHDEVIHEVMEGKADMGAAKNLRILHFESENPDSQLRHLAESEAVPNNALVVHRDLSSAVRTELRDLLLGMDSDPKGQEALQTFGALRWLSCEHREYAAIYDMIDQLGDQWHQTGMSGPVPVRPEDW